MLLAAMLLASATGVAPPAPAPQAVTVDWAAPAGVGTSRTVTTLQVVNNPILDRHFTVNGSTFPNPIHSEVWGSLKNLSKAGLSMARFVPWYPYPRKAVAELYAPVPGQPLSWNFTLLLGQLTLLRGNRGCLRRRYRHQLLHPALLALQRHAVQAPRELFSLPLMPDPRHITAHFA